MKKIDLLVRVAPQATKHFGLPLQFILLCEECGELIQACSKYARLQYGGQPVAAKIDEIKEKIAEEIADVFIMIYEIEQALGLEERVNYWILKKCERLDWRVCSTPKFAGTIVSEKELAELRNKAALFDAAHA